MTTSPVSVPPVVIGIAGCSGSGKTTLALELSRTLGGTHFPLDHYYRDLGHLPLEQRCLQDFDHPDTLESELIVAHVAELAAGRGIDRPVYDFATHTRTPHRTERIVPGRLVLVEGIFALHYKALLPLYSLRVYVEAPDEVCYRRRLARDVCERGRTPESVAAQYASTVRPMAERFVRPSAQYADQIVDGTRSLDLSVEQVLNQLRQRNLMPLAQQPGP
ncbi:MAG TPA: uridine kinase [Acidisarcina sp.]|nr:uridine kinase [Acidisarcina sp.]